MANVVAPNRSNSAAGLTVPASQSSTLRSGIVKQMQLTLHELDKSLRADRLGLVGQWQTQFEGQVKRAAANRLANDPQIAAVIARYRKEFSFQIVIPGVGHGTNQVARLSPWVQTNGTWRQLPTITDNDVGDKNRSLGAVVVGSPPGRTTWFEITDGPNKGAWFRATPTAGGVSKTNQQPVSILRVRARDGLKSGGTVEVYDVHRKQIARVRDNTGSDMLQRAAGEIQLVLPPSQPYYVRIVDGGQSKWLQAVSSTNGPMALNDPQDTRTNIVNVLRRMDLVLQGGDES